MSSNFVAVFISLLIMYKFKRKSFEDFQYFLFLLNIVFSIFITIGFFVRISTIEIEIYRILPIISILHFIIFSKKPLQFKWNQLIIISLFFIVIIIGFISTYIFVISPDTLVSIDQSNIAFSVLKYPVLNSRHIIRIMDLLIFIIYMITIFNLGFFKSNNNSKFLNYFLMFTRAFFVLMSFELLLDLLGLGLAFRNLILWLFGNNTNSVITVPYIRGNMTMLLGTLREPSHLAVILLVLYSFILKGFKVSYKLTTFSLVFSVLSTSTSAIFLSLIFMLILFMINFLKQYRENRSNFFKMLIFLFIAILIFLFARMYIDSIGYFESKIMRFFMTIFNGDLQSVLSFVVKSSREYSILFNLIAFFKNPLFGLGFGTITTYSTIVSLLTNIGILGLVIYLFVIKSFKYRINNISENLIDLFTIIFLFGIGMLGTSYNITFALLFLPFCNRKLVNNEGI